MERMEAMDGDIYIADRPRKLSVQHYPPPQFDSTKKVSTSMISTYLAAGGGDAIAMCV